MSCSELGGGRTSGLLASDLTPTPEPGEAQSNQLFLFVFRVRDSGGSAEPGTVSFSPEPRKPK